MEALNLNKSTKQTFNLLKLTFGIVPIVAVLNKFTNSLTNWENYIHQGIAGMIAFYLIHL